MKASQIITFFLLFAALSLCASGCCRRFLPNPLFASREKSENVVPDDERATFQSEEIETILQIGGRARRLTPSGDSKRVLIERESVLDKEPTQSAYQQAPNVASETEDDLNVELWNLEFSTATQESFRPDEYVLPLQKANGASFSSRGDRLFWLEREPVYAEVQTPNAPSSAFFGGAPSSFELRNVVLTKELEASSYASQFAPNAEQEAYDSSVKRLKTADLVKTASQVRLSPKSRWLICRSINDGLNASNRIDRTQESTSEQKNDGFLYNVPCWTLVYVPNGQRVVHFPETIKLTFDSSTSDETIEGRVVDVLDVSDEGDLVATLAEELPQDSQNKEKKEAATNASANQAQGWNPRYKIIIWDLQVARTVDLEKKRSPLRALEVAQIPLKIPIASNDCHFSENGKILAAKVEPRLISVWQTANGRLKGEFWEDDGYIRDFALASNGMRLVAGVEGKEAEMLLWNVRTGAVQKDVRFPRLKSIDAVTFANSDSDVLFVDSQGVVKRWDVDADGESKRL